MLSTLEERRITKPWEQGVIVKILGRRICYKALENHLRHMWARRGVLNIIDLYQEYYLVTFRSQEGHYFALMEGPWLIYDLTIREWSPNFCPSSDAVEKLAVWVRISGLPIKYYDINFLTFIENMIEKTIKVDKNTLSREKGKCARLCIRVDLTKLLLAMFSNKGRHYKVEYEGLHLLCLNYCRFGHYVE